MVLGIQQSSHLLANAQKPTRDNNKAIKIVTTALTLLKNMYHNESPEKINAEIKIEFRKLSEHVDQVSKLVECCKPFETRERIRILERLAGYQESQRLRQFAFQVLTFELQTLEIMIKNFDGHSIKYLKKIAKTAMDVMCMDVYSKKDEKLKAQLLNSVIEIIDRYFSFESNQTPQSLSRILQILTVDNPKLYYEVSWQHEEKVKIFEPLIQTLLLKVDILLNEDAVFSWEDLSDIFTLFDLSTRTKPLKESILEGLLKQAEELFENNCEISEIQSLHLLSGLTALGDITAFIHSRSQLLCHLTSTAMPLLKTKSARTFTGFRSYEDVKFTTAVQVLSLLQKLPKPHLDSKKYQDLQEEKSARTLYLSKEEMREIQIMATPAAERELQELLFEIDAIAKDDFKKIFATPLMRQQPAQSEKIGGKLVGNLQNYEELLKSQKQKQNPRGLNFLLRNFLGQIETTLKEGRITYSPEDIKKFLSKLSHLVVDITDPQVQSALSHLFSVSISEPYIDDLTPEMALNLLRINMILSINSKSKIVPFTSSQQELLFKKIENLKINFVQARSLFEIRTLGWHGNVPFNHPKLVSQMNTCFKENLSRQAPPQPYPYEQLCYDEISKHLKDVDIKLRLNVVCPQTVREIDIAYEDETVKIAINIDGSPHFDSVTNQQDMNTIFRNALLEKAGWKVIDINLLDFDSNTDKKALKKECKRIANRLKQEVLDIDVSTNRSRPTFCRTASLFIQRLFIQMSGRET